MSKLTAKLENRIYNLEIKDSGKHMEAHLISRGFDGKNYLGVSHPVGRQRKTMTSIFFRNAKTGEFVCAL